MKNRTIKYLKNTLILLVILSTSISCERELSDDQSPLEFSSVADVFTEDFVGLGNDFYLPYGDSKFTAFSVDRTQGYDSNSSIRVDVPNADDTEGAYAGGIFRIDGSGRNLTQYDALTFWVKASQGVVVGEFGFGEDFLENKYVTTRTNVSVGTNWTKVIIPIPDASMLLEERGMFRYSAGTQGTNGFGYILWIDEIKFEKLGTVNLVNSFILNGEDRTTQGFLGTNQIIGETGAIYNLANGQNVTVSAASSYFEFTSSNTALTSPFALNNLGQLFTSITGSEGSAVITAQLRNTGSEGSLTINAVGSFVNAPDPTTNPANVTSIFSDFYSTIPGFNPGVFAGSNTGNISVQSFANNQHVRYQTIDFIGIGWTNPINVSARTMVHVDVQLISGSNLVMELIDFGPDRLDNGFAGSDGTAGGTNISNQLRVGEWVSLNIPLNAFTLPTGGGGAGNPNRNNLGYIVFTSSNGATFLVDNIYFFNN